MANLLKKVGATLFGSGGTPTNSYTSPNLDFLKQGAPQVNYDFLKNYGQSVQGGLTGNAKSYLDYMQPKTAGDAFSQYADKINAPSSVDQVRSDVNNQALQNTLGNIQRDTNQKFGSSLMDSYSKGLYGDGANSDIAANAAAQIGAEGARTASNAYTTLAGQNLDLEKQREQAANTAYGQQYQGALASDQQQGTLAAGAAGQANDLATTGAQLQGNALQNYASGLQNNASLTMEQRKQLSDALLTNAQGQSGGYHAGTTGLLGSTLNAFANGAGNAMGKRAAGG